MIPHSDPDISAHRAAYSFYYERADESETTAMNALCFLNISLTLAVHGNRNHLPTEVLEVLNKTTNVVELQFMEVANFIRSGNAFQSLTSNEQSAMETGCLRIHFHDSTW